MRWKTEANIGIEKKKAPRTSDRGRDFQAGGQEGVKGGGKLNIRNIQNIQNIQIYINYIKSSKITEYELYNLYML